MTRYLLDTNAISEPIRPRPNAAFMAKLNEHAHECAISSVTWHEVVYGLNRLPKGRRKEAIEDYLFGVVQPAFPVLPYDGVAADWHGRERARLMDAGRPPSFPDGQIAAVAKTRGLVLVTANLADLELFDGIEVVSWLG